MYTQAITCDGSDLVSLRPIYPTVYLSAQTQQVQHSSCHWFDFAHCVPPLLLYLLQNLSCLGDRCVPGAWRDLSKC